MTDQDHLDRINALTRNARQTWFALLAALVFVGITLMGVEHIDFYGVDRATELPLVSVEVPTPYFFAAAPIIVAAIYGYFHLYLIRLWDALGAAPTRLNGIALGDAITPWLVSDAALHFRAWRRKDNCTTPRALEGGAMLLNLLLAWGFGLTVLAFLWWLSMPARTFFITGISGLALFVSLMAGGASLSMMVLRLRDEATDRHRNIFSAAPAMAAMITLIPLIAALSYERTRGSPDRLASLDLSGENIVERPAGWLSYRDAKAEFRAEWCRREFIKDAECNELGDRESDFDVEFDRRRKAALNDMRRPDWSPRTRESTHMGLRKATLTSAFLAGANLREAQMEGAVFDFSELTGTPQKINILDGTNLSRSTNNGGLLRFVDLTQVVFGAETDFRNTFLDASVTMTDVFRAQMGEGNPKEPCQGATEVIEDDAEFFGRWRGWIEAKPEASFFERWAFVGPEEWLDVEAIPPPPSCSWKTGPMPGTAG